MYKTISAETIIISHQIKYNVLNEMTNEAFAGSNATSVNIFIDVYQICLKLFRSNIECIGKYSLASYLMNLCAHYRGFYRKFYGVNTKIYLIYTNDIMNFNSSNISNYNQKNNHLFSYSVGVANYIAINTDVLNILTRYFKDIYFIQSPFEAMSMIGNIIEDNVINGNTDPNIILSTSKLLFQLPVFLSKLSKTVIFYHQYNYNGISAHIINNQNAIYKYCVLNKIKYNEFINEINPEFLSIIFALSGYKQRNVGSLLRINTVLKILYQAISQGVLYNSYNANIEIIYKIFKNKLPDFISVDDIEKRFKALDFLYNKNIYKFSTYGKNKDWEVNLYNPDEIRVLNQTKFNNYPIDLERL